MNNISSSEQIWQKYKDSYRKPDYTKYIPKSFYKPINIEKEQELLQEQNNQKSYENSFPYYDDLPRMSQKDMLPTKGGAKMEQFAQFGLFIGIFFGKSAATSIYGTQLTYYKILKTRAFLGLFLSASSAYFTTFALDFQPQNSGINMPLQYEEILHNHYDLTVDAYRDVDNILYNDQKIEKKDYKQINNIIEQRKLELKKSQLFHQI